MTCRDSCWPRQIGERNAVSDRLAAHFFGVGLFQHEFQDLFRAIVGHETHARFVGKHDIARQYADAEYVDRSVDLDRLDPPLACDGREFARPHRERFGSGMSQIANAALDDRADLALLAWPSGPISRPCSRFPVRLG